MTINQIQTVEILSSVWKITYDNTHNGGSFSSENSEIVIGIKCIETDPTYTFSVISHEIMELVLSWMGARFTSSRNDEYLFNFNHQTFENAIQIHSQVMLKFIA